VSANTASDGKDPDIVWIANLELRTLFVSPAIGPILGYTPEERLGQTVAEQLTPASLAIALETLTRELGQEGQAGADPEKTVTLTLNTTTRMAPPAGWKRPSPLSVTGRAT
jgi:PAS domain-containing protein